MAMLAASLLVLSQLNVEWWCYLLVLFAPDISMVGYAVSNPVGAGVYNLFHHKALAVAIGLWGWYAGIPLAEVTGAVLFGHSSLDRMLGYGLKYNRGFKYTHLGVIGRKEN